MNWKEQKDKEYYAYIKARKENIARKLGVDVNDL